MTTLARHTALLVLGIGSLLAAPHAAASPDDDFCRSMTSVGFTGNCATLSTLARDVCAQLARGADASAVAEKLDITTKDETLSNFIVAGARLYFCPEPHQT
ncbi:DUF732 domain-containing protein [Mycolicibacterium holsaticum]|jgi:hypothetical protein|uniref:DUF732 domain-containing protein n=1 Tax=Mycolicibacterium holsaticum TaxID=152142 RepID=A0A1E3S3E1_9MYCO|nr:DUF732 domain-containing protein [Mycolicibacterium holsaticum]MDA4108096.1 hypothetical protein [Mycolicibacterium holsaticum DSM 44478 = JCM 12374]ODQ96630.1 hypothetical protein BHQ17_00210 [Mycolicibacterium holsaticum]QZA14489.1 DUF732 domain-containing protein [Mycolicibacterium holsaticum DSM 44478 = JCM 12374]UNC08063.1 DUF732 domain-containing protein [Mycolicibacterium holsaticum DSM 44478 = JCM 12374]